MSETRTEKEIIAEAYSDEAAKTWRAPVQRYPDTIPWPIHLEAYAAYVKRWSKQTALIDLQGRGCRGGFGSEELDLLVPGWRDRVSYVARLEAKIGELEALIGHQEPIGWVDTIHKTKIGSEDYVTADIYAHEQLGLFPIYTYPPAPLKREGSE